MCAIPVDFIVKKRAELEEEEERTKRVKGDTGYDARNARREKSSGKN